MEFDIDTADSQAILLNTRSLRKSELDSTVEANIFDSITTHRRDPKMYLFCLRKV